MSFFGAPLDPSDDELIRAHVLKRDRVWVRAHPEATFSAREQRLLTDLRMRRYSGEPIPYLIGTQEFYGRIFIVGRGVLVPRPESEHLVEAALPEIARRSVNVADVGTGSGCIGITIALECPSAEIFATDIDPDALHYARLNSITMGVEKRIHYFHGNLLEPVHENGVQPDLIVANLPYLTPHEYRHLSAEPRQALVGGNDGLEAFRNLFVQLRSFNWSVPLILEIDPRRSAEVIGLVTKLYPHAAVVVTKDLARHERVLVVRC